MSDADPQMPPDGAPADGADARAEERPGRLRRALRWTFRIISGLVLFVLLLVALLLYTPLGAVAVDHGLDAYDDMVPGAVERAAVEGSLAHGLTIRDLALKTAAGAPLVQIERLHLEITPSRLFAVEAIVDVLAVEGVRVDVPYVDPADPDAPGPFADLIPPGPSEPEPPPEPSPGIGPDLPLRIEALVDVHRVTLRQQAADGAWQTVVDEAHLVVRAAAEGRTARVELDPQTRVDLPTVPVSVAGAGLVAEWDEPILTVTDLRVASDLGHVAGPRLVLDAESLSLDGGLAVQGLADPLVKRFDLPLDRDPEVVLLANGADGELRLGLLVDPGQGGIDGGLWLRLDARGTAQPLDLKVELVVEGLDLARQSEGLPIGELGAVVRATIAGTTAEDIALDAELDCLGCRIDGVGDLDLALFARLVKGTGSAALRLDAAGVTVDGRAEVWDLADLRAHLDVAVPDLPRTLKAARAFAPDLPEMQGALDLEADCVGPLTAPTCTTRTAVEGFAGQGIRLRRAEVVGAAAVAEGPAFAAHVSARDLAAGQDRFRRLEVRASGDPQTMLVTLDGAPRPGEDLKLAAALDMGPPLDLRLLALDGRARGVRLDLAQDAQVTVDPEGRVRVEGLALGVGRGTVRADGTFDPAGDNDLTLSIDRLNLADLNGFVPGLGLRGRVDVDGRVKGRASDPDLSLDARLRGLRFRGTDLGSARAKIDYDDGRLDADVDLDGGLARSLRIDAEVPFDLNLESGQIGPRFRGSQSIDVAIDDLRLERLEPLLGDAPTPTGRLDLKGRFTGARTPTGSLTLTLTDVEVMQWTAARVALTAGYDGKRATADLEVESPYADRVALEAAAPVRLDLARGVADWRRRENHRVALKIDAIDFAALGERVPAIADLPLLVPPQAPGGEVVRAMPEAVTDVPGATIELAINGPATTPEIGLDVTVNALRDVGIPVTDVNLAVDVDRDGVGLALGVDSPAAKQVAVIASVPLALRPLSSEPVRWRAQDDHAATITVRDADLRMFVPTPTPKVAGRADLRLQVAGNARRPQVTGRIEGRGLELDARQLGRVEVDLDASHETAAADVRWVPDSDTLLTLEARVPIEVDVEAQRFAWRETADHHLDLRFSGIDRGLITQFAPLAKGTDPSLTLAVTGKGHLEAFEVDIDIDGAVKLPTGYSAPVQGRVRVRPDSQTVSIKSPLSGDDLNLDVKTDAPVPALVAGEADVQAIAYEARVDIPGLSLKPLGPLMPISLYDPEGELFVDVSGAGTVGEPKVSGRVGLKDGAITLVDLSQRVEDIQLALAATEKSVDIETLRADSGGGTLKGAGSVELAADGPRGAVEIELDRWPLVRPGVPRALVGVRVTTDVESSPGTTRVRVGVHEGEVRLIGQNVSAPKAIPENGRVVFEEPPPPPEMMPPGVDSAAGQASDGEDGGAPAPDPRRLAIEVGIEDPFYIRGSGIDMTWDGRIIAITKGAETQVQGALQSIEGGFSLLGRDFRLTQGRVYLPEGGGAPYLDVIAKTTVETYTITASIRGKPDRPILEFSSDPALPDYQILTVLVTGAPESGGDGDGEGSVAREAASLLAAFQNSAIEDALNERLGIDRVGIEFGDTIDQPILTVGKRISPDLYVETVYHQNAPDDANSIEARARFRITPQWSFETAAGDKGIGVAELIWVRHFGGDQAAKTLDELQVEQAPPDEEATNAAKAEAKAEAMADDPPAGPGAGAADGDAPPESTATGGEGADAP